MVKRDPDSTRQKILCAAFGEIHRNGFRSASVDQILRETGLTKGAFYHHFKTKAELGYAVVEDVIKQHILETWVGPMEGATDPLQAMMTILDNVPEEHMREGCEYGCPLNNLAQEMSPIDETFRKKLQSVLDLWRRKLAEAFLRGQGAGKVRRDIDCHQAAAFVVASLEGAFGMAKNAQDPTMLTACHQGLIHYLEALRPRLAATTSTR